MVVKWEKPTKEMTVPKQATIRTIDSKGRVNVGSEFAGRHVLVEADESGIALRYVDPVPVQEAWLWRNREALERVRQGVEEAQRGELSSGPEELEQSLDFADALPTDE